jgi:hypothetical protein
MADIGGKKVRISYKGGMQARDWRIARRVEDLDDETLAAIARSKVAPEYAALDEIIKDWNPEV